MSQHFQRGSGCYRCSSCGKRTRDTGDGEADVELCRKCSREGLRENFHSDKGHTGTVESCVLCTEAGYDNAWVNS